MEDVSVIRLRMAEVVLRAETDESFHQRLIDDPATVLADNGIPEGSIEEFSRDLDRGVRGLADGSLADEEEFPPCIHTQGCNDFTCFTSRCPATCFITIKIDAPDA
jgi:hypothetical protein